MKNIKKLWLIVARLQPLETEALVLLETEVETIQKFFDDIRNRNIEELQKAITNGMNAWIQNEEGKTAMYVACGNGDKQLLQSLLTGFNTQT
ncbi:MAG UNVERIFIED_CONTAM: ankyrin repeat domain-containing protein [Rickettsiaceae bacterium]|jgi:hypothetical protein